MCESDVLGSVITFVSVVLDASPSVNVVTKLQLTIEAMLRAAADPITDERHIPYQIVVSWNAKLHGLCITLFVAISCSGGDLTIDANSQSADASQLRRHIHDMIIAGNLRVHYGHPKDEGLAANVKDSMDAGGMAAADVTQASEQAKSREFLTKHRFKEP